MMKDTTLKKYKEYIGKIFGNFLVIDIDLKVNNKIYFECKCLKCNSITYIRSDGLSKNRVGCKYCIGEWRKNNFEKRYKHLLPKNIRHKYIHFKCAAKKRNLEFLLTKEEAHLLFNAPCYYCGKQYCLGIDRLNNSMGYTKENSVPCCGCCNKMKMDLTLPFFIQQIKKIYKNHKESSTTISEESTSKVIVDGNGEHLRR